MTLCSTFVRIITAGPGGVNIYQSYLIYCRRRKVRTEPQLWTLGNIRLMGIYAAMFSFDMWVE